MSDLSMEEIVKQVGDFVIRNYKLEPLNIDLIEDGIASINYYVRTKTDHFIIRYDQRRSPDLVDSDKNYILAAKNSGVNVPPMPILVEEFFGKAISGRRAITGETLSQATCTNEIIKNAGKQLGLIHTATSPSNNNGRKFFYNFVFDTNDFRWEDIFRYACNHPYLSIKSISINIANEISSLGKELIASGLLGDGLTHGDYTFSNLLVDDYSQLVILDWEKSCKAFPIYDLGLGLFYLVCGGGAFRPDIIPVFLHGYFSSNTSLFKTPEILASTIDVAVKAFFLMDTTFVAKDIACIGISSLSRRQKFFETFCWPSYKIYEDNKRVIQKTLYNCIQELD